MWGSEYWTLEEIFSIFCATSVNDYKNSVLVLVEHVKPLYSLSSGQVVRPQDAYNSEGTPRRILTTQPNTLKYTKWKGQSIKP